MEDKVEDLEVGDSEVEDLEVEDLEVEAVMDLEEVMDLEVDEYLIPRNYLFKSKLKIYKNCI